MRNKNEIQELKQELEMLTGFIGDYGTEQEFKDKCVSFSCDVIDALAWVMEEIETEHFKSDNYLDLFRLHAIAKKIEQRIGKKRENL
jgi:hypothetical protein